ncbi:MAG: ABC transporter permease [Bacteroidota bacterium]
MFDFDKWQEIFNTIMKHKLRTFMTALGVFWGIFMLILLMGAGSGLENGVTGLFGGHAKNSMYVWTNRTTKPFNGRPPGRYISLTNDDVRAIQAQFGDQIEYVSKRLNVRTSVITRGDRQGDFDVRGDTPDMLDIDAFELINGRFLNERDMNNRRKVIVIGKRVQEVLFEEEEDPIGEYIKVGGTEYLVVGVLKSDRRGSEAADDEEVILMPLTTAQQITNQPNRIHWFLCSTYANVRVSEVEEKVKTLLRQRHDIAPDDPQGIGSNNVEEEFRQINGLFIGIKFITWFVGIGTLLAGIIGVGNIMLIVVKERTKEIGIRKAMGATPGSIISMIMLESVFITTIAGYAGLAFSTCIVALMNMAVSSGGSVEFYANPEVDFGVGISALLILIISGALIGLVPALHAARINPVQALKDE